MMVLSLCAMVSVVVDANARRMAAWSRLSAAHTSSQELSGTFTFVNSGTVYPQTEPWTLSLSTNQALDTILRPQLLLTTMSYSGQRALFLLYPRPMPPQPRRVVHAPVSRSTDAVASSSISSLLDRSIALARQNSWRWPRLKLPPLSTTLLLSEPSSSAITGFRPTASSACKAVAKGVLNTTAFAGAAENQRAVSLITDKSM